jgi:hypothetical protein
MANTNKTKAEILQELESIKGLLLEEDDIPILQEAEAVPTDVNTQQHPTLKEQPFIPAQAESTLPGQGSLFEGETKRQGFASHLNTPAHQHQAPRPLAKATGENPFLPQHIRERLHGNNPPPLFEYEAAKKIINATKNIAQKINKPRQVLIDDVINSLMPQIESELRHRMFAMRVEDLEKLLNQDED